MPPTEPTPVPVELVQRKCFAERAAEDLLAQFNAFYDSKLKENAPAITTDGIVGIILREYLKDHFQTIELHSASDTDHHVLTFAVDTLSYWEPVRIKCYPDAHTLVHLKEGQVIYVCETYEEIAAKLRG